MAGKLTKEFLALQDQFIANHFGNAQCRSCKWYLGKRLCDAFLKGIPLDIMSGRFEHTELYPTQENDILFEPKEE